MTICSRRLANVKRPLYIYSRECTEILGFSSLKSQ